MRAEHIAARRVFACILKLSAVVGNAARTGHRAEEKREAAIADAKAKDVLVDLHVLPAAGGKIARDRKHLEDGERGDRDGGGKHFVHELEVDEGKGEVRDGLRRFLQMAERLDGGANVPEGKAVGEKRGGDEGGKGAGPIGPLPFGQDEDEKPSDAHGQSGEVHLGEVEEKVARLVEDRIVARGRGDAEEIEDLPHSNW